MHDERSLARHRALRRAPAVFVALAVVSSAAGCGSAPSSAPSSSGPVQSLLVAGLKAQRLGHLAQADDDYLNVLKLDSSNVYAWYNLGVIAQGRGYASGAVRDYRQAVAGDPRFVAALYNLATVVAATDPVAAAKLYRRVVKLSPKNAAAHYNLGLALQASGHAASGRTEIQEAIALDPKLAATTSTTTAP